MSNLQSMVVLLLDLIEKNTKYALKMLFPFFFLQNISCGY